MRVLVCGGRDFRDVTAVYHALDQLDARYPITHLIQGGARGVDEIAAQWAEARHKELRTFPAHWDLHGKAAGPIRNKQMLEEGHPEIVVAFPGGRGTENMVQLAEKAGVHVHKVEITYPDHSGGSE